VSRFVCTEVVESIGVYGFQKVFTSYSSAVKSAIETVEEAVGASEKEVSVSKSSCHNTSMVSKTRHSREPLIRTA
jgi:4-hydroxy-3-methylbut-2-enyl diphosphate reductase IspH